ncbi:plant basic secretory protein [Leucogyrophana mollusca]|uniref:Plant basic secretory protein n=1 Tax=Leucogyrophana mollusca TaxID=85980 RepID=A0ACB8BXV4_9AGAM|nr:plant basic secretory protein [Leucogyrophana mollusca]
MPPPSSPVPSPRWVIPNFILKVEDLNHPGATIFFDNVKPRQALEDAVTASYKWMYTQLTSPTHVKKITLVLRSFEGVAYTFGTHTDKEIHFSLDHIKNSESHARNEILGVLTHEVVHCYQYNAKDTCPGGLVEGIADFVRLHAGFVPSHWRPSCGDKWDAGYDTTAYFLDWIEKRYGEGTVRKINGSMRDSRYSEKVFKDATGLGVEKLWQMYCENLTEKS